MMKLISCILDDFIKSCDKKSIDSRILKNTTERAKAIIDRINILVNTPITGVTVEDFEKELETKNHIVLMDDKEYEEYNNLAKLKTLLKESDII